MCTKTIVESTGAGELGVGAAVAAGLIGGPAASLAVIGAARAVRGKRVIGSDILPKPPKLPPVKPPPDLAAEERRKRAMAIQRTLAGRPGPGRRATIKTGQATGAGPVGLKTATGQ